MAAQVFSLKHVAKANTFFQSSADASVERLATFFEVSISGFQEQLHRLRPLAEKRNRDTNGGTREAWTATMKATQSRNSMKDWRVQWVDFLNTHLSQAWQGLIDLFAFFSKCQESYPTADVAPVMHRYLAWQASTSGVEQNFAKGERMKTFGQTPASDVSEERALKVMLCKFTPAELDVVLRQTRDLYIKCMPGAKSNYNYVTI